MSFPEPGEKAHPFTLTDTNGKKVKLTELKGNNVVLYFYPKDNTPGCTLEAHEFSKLLPQFKKKNAVVYGVSKDDLKSHQKFTDKCKLKVSLLSDPTGKTIEKYGALKEKSMFGKKYLGIQRATVLIDDKGKVKKVWKRVQPIGHAKKVLEEI